MLKVRYILAVVMVGFLYLQASYFGVNDYISGCLILVNTFVMYSVVLKLQEGNKRALRINAKEGGFMHLFLSKEKTLFMRFVSLMASLFLSLILVVMLKGITLNHGMIAFFVLITIISLTIFSFLNEDNTKSKLISDNLAEDLSNHANNFLYVILVAIMLNFALSLLLSSHDVMIFLSNDINFENFDVFALESAIVKTDSNSFSRPIMNLYILLDTFKVAVAGQLMDLFLERKEQIDFYYVFYIIIFVLNMLKLFAFSMSFVLLQKGLEGLAKRIIPVIKGAIKFKKANQDKIDKVSDSIKKGASSVANDISEKTKETVEKVATDIQNGVEKAIKDKPKKESSTKEIKK